MPDAICIFNGTTYDGRKETLGPIDFIDQRRHCLKCGFWMREYDLVKTDEYICDGGGMNYNPTEARKRMPRI